MFDALNNLLKDDQIWIVQVSPVGPDGKDMSGELFDNAEPFTFDTSGGASPSKDKALVTDLHVVAINRNGENAGANAVEFFKSIVSSPKANQYFEFQGKNDDERLKKYLRNEVGDLALKDGYAFKMRLPLKRKVEVTVREKP